MNKADKRKTQWVGCAASVLINSWLNEDRCYFGGKSVGFLLKMAEDLYMFPFEGSLKEIAKTYDVSAPFVANTTPTLIDSGLLKREGGSTRRGRYVIQDPDWSHCRLGEKMAEWLGKIAYTAYSKFQHDSRGVGASILPVAHALSTRKDGASVPEVFDAVCCGQKEVKRAVEILEEDGFVTIDQDGKLHPNP
jgi:hypothetical protein